MDKINVNKTNHTICWIVIYPLDSVIQSLNNLNGMSVKFKKIYCLVQVIYFDFQHNLYCWNIVTFVVEFEYGDGKGP